MSAVSLRAASEKAEEREAYTVAQIREAYAKHASRDDWDIPSFYESSLINALRGAYHSAVIPDVTR